MQPSRSILRRSRLLRPVALAAAGTLLAIGAAHAAVSTSAPPDQGSFAGITYGNTGNVADLIPRLFVQGVGNAASPAAVSTLNPLLQYDFGVSGDGSNLLTVEYRVRNTSALESFSQLRFMVFASPDGDGNFLDNVSEAWGPIAATDPDPVRREARAFVPGDAGILSGIALNNNVTDTLGACAGASCDANVALQWNAATLGPGEMFRVRVGLSDTGQALSSRFLTITSVQDPDTALTLSGNAAVVAVPEPATTALLLAGLLGVGFMARRRGAPAGWAR